MDMTRDSSSFSAHRPGEQSLVVANERPGGVDLDSFFGPVRVEWDHEAALTPLGQLPFFIDFLKASGLFDALVADCPLRYGSPNAPKKRDVVGTAMLAMLAGHKRYAHIAALRCDAVLPELLGMSKIISEDAVRRAFKAVKENEGAMWLRRHLADLCGAASGRAVDPRRRYDDQAALWLGSRASWGRAQDRSFLMAIERLDRRIDVRIHGWARSGSAAISARCRRGHVAPSILLDRLEGPADRVLADDLAHAERFRKDSVAAQRSDMGVALVAGQHGEHRRPHNVALLWRIGIAVAQRTVGDQGVEQSARLEEINEERQLPKRRQRRLVIPFDTDRTKETVKIDAARPFVRHNQRLLTRPVSRKAKGIARHVHDNAQFASNPETRNRRI